MTQGFINEARRFLQLRDQIKDLVKIIAVSFGKPTSKCIDHGLDLCVGKYLVNAGLLHIQDLSSDRQDCLVVPVSGCLCRTARRISLYDKNLTFFCIPALTVCQFPIAVKGIFLLCQKIRLRSGKECRGNQPHFSLYEY